MNTMKLMFITLAAMALVLTITHLAPTKRESFEELPVSIKDDSKTSSISLSSSEEEQTVLPMKRVIHRSLTEKNPRAVDHNEKFHCNKDEAVCGLKGSPGSSCCNNKCVDLTTDKQNCGACKNKCKYPESCCRGKCVNLAFDKRHCGECNHRCMTGGYCVYGMCNYA